MANTAFIIHGAEGYPEENWFPWLKHELEKIDYKVFVPQFPTPSGQNLNSWLKVFDKYLKDGRLIDKNTILIGHSIGATFLLSILGKLSRPIKAAFFVAGFINDLDDPPYDKINRTFYKKKFDWEKIKKK